MKKHLLIILILTFVFYTTLAMAQSSKKKTVPPGMETIIGCHETRPSTCALGRVLE